MKKAKLMLATIAVLATVGAALAFKASLQNVCYYERFHSPGFCNLVTTPGYNIGPVTNVGPLYNTVVTDPQCPLFTECLTRHVVTFE